MYKASTCRLENLVCINGNAIQIIPNGEEIVPAVLAFAEELNKNPLKKQ